MSDEAKGGYILVQPLKSVQWAVQMYAVGDEREPDPREALPEELFDSAAAAVSSAEERAQRMFVGIRVVSDGMSALDSTTFGEETMIKVYSAFMKLNVPRDTAIQIVNAIQNEGILFRERLPEPDAGSDPAPAGNSDGGDSTSQ